MAEIRFNYGDKFTQTTDTNTGIGSTIPAAKLDVAGNTSAGSLRVSGIATLSSYQGFVNTKLTTPTEGMIVEAGQSGSVSGEVVVSTGQTISVSSGATTGQGGIQSLKVSQTFMPPVGGTADRPTDVKPGMVYYNKDFKPIAVGDGNYWKQLDNTTRRGRGVFGGGFDGPSPFTNAALMHMIEISTLGNSEFFGDLTQQRRNPGGRVSNGTRGLILGGYHEPVGRDTIDYCTIASAGDFVDFGNLTTATYAIANGGVSSSTRGVVGGGVDPSPAYVNVMQYVQIQTIGNALDFGDLTTTIVHGQAVNSQTKGLFCGGMNPGLGTRIQSITISSTGNAVDIADLQQGRFYGAGVSNGVRGVVGGGFIVSPMASNGMGSSLEFVTIASDGNAVVFGDLTQARGKMASAETHTRGVFIGSDSGNPSTNTYTNVMDFINIASAGNAQDFGDATNDGNHQIAGFSDSHGGLGGY